MMRLAYVLAILTWSVTLGGCANGGTAFVAAPVPVSSTTTLQTAGANLAYPADGGYTATFAYSINNAPSDTTVTVTSIANPSISIFPANMPPANRPPGTMLIAYELTVDQTVRFNVWNGFVSSVVLPQSIQAQQHVFGDYGYDLTVGAASGSDPGTVAGSVVTFPAGRFPVTLQANHTYLMVLSMR